MNSIWSYKGKVTNVVDGDTVDVDVDLGFYVSTQLRFRLAGIDAHEIRGVEESVKALGMEEKRFLEELILDKDVIIQSDKTGKYGRWICELWLNKENVNFLMDRYIKDTNRLP